MLFGFILRLISCACIGQWLGTRGLRFVTFNYVKYHAYGINPAFKAVKVTIFRVKILNILAQGELIVYPCSGIRCRRSRCRCRGRRQQFQTSSPPKPLGQSKLNLHGTSLGRGNESLYKWLRPHYQIGRHAHIW